jgi:hypothetical protein
MMINQVYYDLDTITPIKKNLPQVPFFISNL